MQLIYRQIIIEHFGTSAYELDVHISEYNYWQMNGRDSEFLLVS